MLINTLDIFDLLTQDAELQNAQGGKNDGSLLKPGRDRINTTILENGSVSNRLVALISKAG
jgi:hypothetical protein